MKKFFLSLISVGLYTPLICLAGPNSLSSIKLYWLFEEIPTHAEIIRVSAGGSPASRNLEDVHLELKRKAIKHNGDAVKNVMCDEYQGQAGIFYKCEGDVIMYLPAKDASKEKKEKWERLMTEKHTIYVNE